MKSILHDSSLPAQWLGLVQEAQASMLIDLEEELESYLVFLLIRFTKRPDIVNENIGLNFLNCYHNHTGYHRAQHEQALQAIGDQCLLFSGLFPGRTQKRGLRLSYLVKLGQISYGSLGLINPVYHHLSMKFTLLMDTLLAIRGRALPSIDDEQGLDLFKNTQSRYADHLIKMTFKKIPD